MRWFDRFVVVDWSAANRPTLGPDSIWVCVAGPAHAPVVANLATRRAAERWLRAELAAAVAAGERTLVGTDFCHGYPAGFAAAVAPGDPTWRGVWAHLAAAVTDDAANQSDRFEVAARLNRRLAGAGLGAPFWGRPAAPPVPDLPATRPAPGPLAEWRGAEAALRAGGHRPHAVWKLAYAGAVGSQTLLGIPVLERLRTDPLLARCTRVWPFEPVAPPPARPLVVHAETWPALFAPEAEEGTCRDERQVRAVVAAWQRLDGAGRLAPLLAGVPDLPAVRAEEGWVLGAARIDPAPRPVPGPAR
ncbi:MAG TPA: hypothetical protein VFP61_10165 [Acidimicrobiales bacterium]|nr:hypothetical protein [Acidimicrobiales bacterium]